MGKYNNLFIFSKKLNQPKSKFLNNMLKSIDGVEYFPFSEHKTVVSPDKALFNSLMIYDDIVC